MTEKQSNFFRSIVAAAQAAQQRWGVPASVTMAQAILESGWGESALAREANNYFGVKAASQACATGYVEFCTLEFVDGKSQKEMARFAKYPTVQAGFDAHAVLLSSLGRYKPAMQAKDDPEEFARQLQACGYSTNSRYADLLIRLMRIYDLPQYDIEPDPPAQNRNVA